MNYSTDIAIIGGGASGLAAAISAKRQNKDLDEIYEKFGVDYDLLSMLMYREADEEGHFHIRWGEQNIA